MRSPRTSPALVAGALIAVVLTSVGFGWFAADQMSHRGTASAAVRPDPAEPAYDGEDPPGAAAPATAAAPELPPEPAPVPVTTAAPEPGAAPPPPAITSPAPPDVAPAPSEPAPVPAPQPPPDDRTAPEPSLTPYEPPPTVVVDAATLPSDGRAWSLITAARTRAPAGSRQRADLDWLVTFARESATPGNPEGRRETARRALRFNAWWYSGHAAPDARIIARDPDGILLTYKRGHGFMVNPVATMGRWRGLNESWTPAELAETLLPMLVSRGYQGSTWAALEYFDVSGEPSVVRPGVSGMGQARAASLFARAWTATRDPRFADAAERVIRSFTVPVDAGGAVSTVRDPAGGPGAPWYPERAHPGEDGWTGAALNGFMVTLIALRSAADDLGAGAAPVPATGTAPQAPAPGQAATDRSRAAGDLARDLADRGARSLVRFLPLHDSGSWSYYGLLTPGRPWRSYLADLNYHCYHVVLLRSLDALYPGEGLGRTADAWQGYVDQRGATCPAR